MKTATLAAPQAVPQAAKQFVIACPAGSDLEEIIASLYFLPEHYTLVIDRQRAAFGDSIDSALAHRVRFADDSAAQGAVPIVFADATITEDKVSAAAGDLSNDLMAHTPEAYASAILNVARATA